jgi:general secretion pathway protein K
MKPGLVQRHIAASAPAAKQRGAALLLAMIILTLVSTVAAGMVWQQSRAIQVEAAERARVQSAWMLNGALDWARLILRDDARPTASGNGANVDHPGEVWATPLAEARLSSFLAADRDNTTDSGPEAFLSGSIADAQSRYNLRNLVDNEGKLVAAEQRTLQRLCDVAGVPADVGGRIAQGLRAAWAPADGDGATDSEAPLAPSRLEQLVWLGIDKAALQRLQPFVVLLPLRTPVNVNTASREVLVAVLDGLDLGTAERLVQVRAREPFKSIEQLREQLSPAIKTEDTRVSVGSTYFEVLGRLRLEDRILEEHSLLERRSGDRGSEVVAVQRERRSVLAVAP